MPAFLDSIGIVQIPESKRDEYRQRMGYLFREGGMMNVQELELYGKQIQLLSPVEMDENGEYHFCRNYYENSSRETAGIENQVFSGEVGTGAFGRVMAAAYVLEEQYSETACFVDLRDIDLPNRTILGWLRYLFGEKFPLRNISIWNQYAFLKTTGRYDDSSSWENCLMNDVCSKRDIVDIMAMMTVEYGMETMRENLLKVQKPDVDDSMAESDPNHARTYKRIKELLQEIRRNIPGTEEQQLQHIQAYLSADKERFVSLMIDKAEPKIFHGLVRLAVHLPIQVTVEAVAEVFHQDFWKLWETAQNGTLQRMIQIGVPQEPLKPVSTNAFLQITSEDRLFCLPPKELKSLLPETREWFSELGFRFQDHLQKLSPCNNDAAFQWMMMGTLHEVQKYGENICAFRDMFFEFLSNWECPDIQAMWHLFMEMAEDGIPLVRLKQYLALLANPPLRKAVLGSKL